jgi:hypothetical protein
MFLVKTTTSMVLLKANIFRLKGYYIKKANLFLRQDLSPR